MSKLWCKLIDFLAFCLGLVALASGRGRLFIAWLVKIQKWIEEKL